MINKGISKFSQSVKYWYQETTLSLCTCLYVFRKAWYEILNCIRSIIYKTGISIHIQVTKRRSG